MKKLILTVSITVLTLVVLSLTGLGMYWAITDIKETVDMTYTFAGTNKDTPGFGEGEITITPTESTVTEGYYLLYFADRFTLLEGYDEFACVPITGETVTYTVKEGTLLPENATRLLVFESRERFLDDPPAYDTAVGVVAIPRDKRLKLSDTELTFGAISDVHMNYQPYNRGAYEKWEAALNTFAAEKMDYVIVTGDMTGDESEAPLTSQYQTYLDIIEKSDYPLENIFEGIGNHGNTKQGCKTFVEYTSGEGEDHPFEGSPWYSVLIEGKSEKARDNLFVFMAQELKAPGDSASYDNFSKEQINWVEGLLKEYGNTDTNIFLIEHSPFLDFGPGDRHGGGYRACVNFKFYYYQTLRLKALLEEYKNVIMMSGHTHLSLYDNENYSTEDNSFCHMVHVGSGCQPNSYGTGDEFTRNTDGRYEVSPTYGSEAYTVAVYEDYIVYTGRNLSTGKIIPAACYIIPT